ncbi:hypothetical protein MBLNU459_g2552t1 [Dothideomycetes sp. NU459]
MPPLIRRAPLSERIKALLNPYDLLLWLSEELHESAWDERLRDWTVPIGIAANLIFMIARANSGGSSSARRDDVFGDFDGRAGSGWFAWLASFTAHFLALVSVLNAAYTFTRSRNYRLFESNIDQPPSTPSARRVRVDSSPMSSSPMHYFSSVFNAASAASRVHPDEHNDVWEVSVWDPKPLNLELFALFSPGHILVYWVFLPTSSMDPRPSVTVATTILLSALMSVQLLFFKRFFVQQAKDSSLIHREVMNEYDTKFVHPTLNRPVRDVGVQTRETATSPRRTKTREVDVYTPTTIINRGFRINPNPSYAGHLGDDVQSLYATSPSRRSARSSATPVPNGPSNGGVNRQTSFGVQTAQDVTSGFTPLKPSVRQPISRGDGGSLGVYSHAASPLRKSASSGLLRPDGNPRSSSPLKRMSTPGNVGGDGLSRRFAGLREDREARRDTGRF